MTTGAGPKVEVFELPVDEEDAWLVRSYEVNVPTETGRTVVVNVIHDVLYDTYEVKFTGEVLRQSPQGVTAAVQMALLAIRQEVAP